LSPIPPKLFANETLYQLTHTPNLIKGNYPIKKIHGKIKPPLSAWKAALPLHRKLVSGNASGSFGSGKTSFELYERSSR
jgi:hypothetical protein